MATFLFRKSWKIWVSACFFTSCANLLLLADPLFYLFVGFGNTEQPVSVIMAAQAYVSMVSAFVPLPGASGGAEGSFVLFFSTFFQNGTIIPAMVIWRTCTYYLNIPVGGLCAYIAGRLPRYFC